MSDVVERGARAQCEAFNANRGSPVEWDKMFPRSRKLWLEEFAAGLAALKPGDVLPNGLMVVEAKAPPKPDPDDWIEWRGGENPVPGRMVEYKLIGTPFIIRRWGACNLSWARAGNHSDIISYRVIEP